MCEAEVITITQHQIGTVLNRFFTVHEFTIDIKMIIKADLSLTSSPSSCVNTVSRNDQRRHVKMHWRNNLKLLEMMKK